MNRDENMGGELVFITQAGNCAHNLSGPVVGWRDSTGDWHEGPRCVSCGYWPCDTVTHGKHDIRVTVKQKGLWSETQAPKPKSSKKGWGVRP